MNPIDGTRDDLTDYLPEECLGQSFPLCWQMTRVERFSLLHLLRVMNPDLSIEVGTYKGGSLQVLSRFSRRVVSIDIDPDVAASLKGQFLNVEFRIGNSTALLPALIDEINMSPERVGFVLIDADHTEDGVWRDVTAILRLRPRRPVCVVVHDSFHPPSRRALRRVEWRENRYIHYVDLDFAQGILVPGRESAEETMFGGLALALMLPDERSFPLEVFESQRQLFELAERFSGGQRETRTSSV